MKFETKLSWVFGIIIVVLFSLVIFVVLPGIQTTEDKHQLSNESKGSYQYGEWIGGPACNYYNITLPAEEFNNSGNYTFFSNGSLTIPEYPKLTFYDRTAVSSAIEIGNGTETIMIIYTNGTYWVEEGKEQFAGEQLGKVAIGFGSYVHGYCDALEQESEGDSK